MLLSLAYFVTDDLMPRITDDKFPDCGPNRRDAFDGDAFDGDAFDGDAFDASLQMDACGASLRL